jgi:fucose 4-O-acetylase-like acetyltransferase
MASSATTLDQPRAPGATSRPAAERVEWVDVTRGLAILLVVFGHAAAGLIDAAEPGAYPILRYLFLAIYTFHMPVFFFLAGMFAEQRFARGAAPFVRRLSTTLVYPYFLWSIIQFCLIAAAASLVNHPPENFLGTLLALPWQPVSQFWFLHALFVIHLASLAAWHAGGARAVLGLAVAAKVVSLLVPIGPALSMAAANAPYYALGLVIGSTRFSRWLASASSERQALLYAVAAISIGGSLAIANAVQSLPSIESSSAATIARVAWLPAMLPAALLGGLALMLVGRHIGHRGGALAQVARYLGSLTLPIFLLHIIFIAGTRILLDRLLGISGLPVLPLLIVVGVVGPLAVRSLADRFRLSRIAGLA